jgi:hypothetical protein
MKITINNSLLISVLLYLTISLSAQDIQWTTTPPKGFVYQINNREAQRLLSATNPDSLYKKLLHTQIDTFDVAKGWLDRPSKGHFILVSINQNKLHCEYTSVFPYQVFLFQEYNALALQVLDLEGNVREDAKVRMGFTKIAIDKESKTYRIENEWVRRTYSTVTVEMDGFRSVFNIEKHEVPVWYNNYNSSSSRPDFYSYMITDKNKYRPNELIRYKSFALSQMRSPIRKTLELWISNYPKSMKIGTVEPHRPGSFAGEFVLHDSLKLQLDKNYRMELRESNGRIVANCRFSYEDYELFGNKLEMSLAMRKHYFPDINHITITATDVNGLVLKDAKADILIKTINILQTFQPQAILADSLFFTTISLDPAGATEFVIPDSIFQKTNTDYQVIVTVLNSENERLEISDNATFFYSQYELTTHFSNDSICFDLLKNNVPMQQVPIELRLNDDIPGQRVDMPYKTKLNPAVLSYNFNNENVSKQFQLKALNPEVKALGGIERDSFNIRLSNPQRLDISWYVYQGSTLLFKGFGKEMDTSLFIDDRTQTFYVEFLYSLGGQEHSKRNQFEFKEEFLDVTLDIPEKIYPGQQVDATIMVKDKLGHPVRNVDLTALAVTGKLNYDLPDLPYYGSSSIPRPKSAHYTMDDRGKRSASLKLDFRKWEKKAGLDTNRYFQFIYPWGKYFMYSIDIEDSTQFAPYVMKDGRAIEIYVIEVDRKPVYYSWTDQPSEYSFRIVPGKKHEITLRLYDRVLILDSIAFKAGKKTLLSLDIDHLPRKIESYKLKTEFSGLEINRHKSYIAAFQRVPYHYAYLQTEDQFIPLFGSSTMSSYNNRILAGPVTPGMNTYSEESDLRTVYRHSGGFKYSFEDNIVYKQNDKDQIPQILKEKFYNPLDNINDRVLTKRKFLDMQYTRPKLREWHAGIIDITSANSRMKIFLPPERMDRNIALVLFEDCRTKSVSTPCYNSPSSNKLQFFNMPDGLYNAVVVYSDGSYLRSDNMPFRKYRNFALDLKCAKQFSADSLSRTWLIKFDSQLESCYYQEPSKTVTPRSAAYIYSNNTGNVTGTIYDASNEPIPGVTIIVKGTSNGAITDMDGHFALYIDDYMSTLDISFIGFVSQEIEVERGSHIIVNLEEEIMALEEIVVVGYGVQRKSELTGSVVSISGEDLRVPEAEEMDKEANIDDKTIREAEQRLYQELLTLNTIRSNFSDVGFWEPKLFTDKLGESKFKVKFPDDITRWEATVYAMNRHLQTGTVHKSIKAYKPLMAELHVPQFLTRGDSAYFLGKVLNYTNDSSITGETNWNVYHTDLKKNVSFGQFLIDKIPVFAAGTDSITTSFTFTRNDGYLDGEERTVSVVEQGIERADGKLSLLNNGDTLNIKTPGDKKVTVEILDNQTEIYALQVRNLLNYRYDCNEQLASKLIGFITYKYYMQYKGKRFIYDQDVNRIIRRLLKNQNNEFLWSWWELSPNTSYWMSAHILRALKFAKDDGYNVDLNIENLARKSSYKFDILGNYSNADIELLNCLADWKANLNYRKYVHILDSILIKSEYPENPDKYGYNYHYSYLKDKLLLQEVKLMTGLSYKRDTLLKYQKEGMLGDIYFKDYKPELYWYADDLATNIIAYRLIQKDSVLQPLKAPMQMYFLSLRRNGEWNTYQSSNVVMSILPDLMREGLSEKSMAGISVSGKEEKVITKFPYKIELQPDEELTVIKESGLPLYYMQYTHEKVTVAKTGVEGFEIKSYFESGSMDLEEGKPVNLKVDVKVLKTAKTEYVMIEVPIPGSCSYGDKRISNYQVETHREYFKERTVIFCERMQPGEYTFSINLLPRFTGSYILNPAQVSLMYFPVVNANTSMKKVKVQSR